MVLLIIYMGIMSWKCVMKAPGCSVRVPSPCHIACKVIKAHIKILHIEWSYTHRLCDPKLLMFLHCVQQSSAQRSESMCKTFCVHTVNVHISMSVSCSHQHKSENPASAKEWPLSLLRQFRWSPACRESPQGHARVHKPWRVWPR